MRELGTLNRVQMRELGTLNGIQMRELEERKWKTFLPDFAAGGSHLDRPGMFTKKQAEITSTYTYSLPCLLKGNFNCSQEDVLQCHQGLGEMER